MLPVPLALWRRGRRPGHWAPRLLPTSPSLRHTLRLTRITPTDRCRLQRFHEAAMQRSISPRYRSPPTAALTFNRLTNGNGHSPFANTFGDPVILYNKPTQTWFTVWLDTECGGAGFGGYKSTTPGTQIAGPISAFTPTATMTGNLAGRTTTLPLHTLEPCTSPGMTSILASGALEVTFSTDNGATWHAPVVVSNTYLHSQRADHR